MKSHTVHPQWVVNHPLLSMLLPYPDCWYLKRQTTDGPRTSKVFLNEEEPYSASFKVKMQWFSTS